jgi:hypothetical protein
MCWCRPAILLVSMFVVRADAALPALVRLEQAPPRNHAKLKLPKSHIVGPALPGLRQGAVPQGLAYWEKSNWLLISCYFEDGRPSAVVAIDNKTGKLVRCLTLVEPDGKGHNGHVGGLAVSEKYLWVGSGLVYRVPLDDLAAAQPVDHLQLREPFRAESTASYITYHNKRLWVGEFVLEDEVKPRHPHHLKDRNGTGKYAWVAGYDLNANDDLMPAGGGRREVPSAIFSVRQKVQGIAFLDGRIILSVSYGRQNDSTLAVYKNPLVGDRDKPHHSVSVGGHTVPVWFLDGKNRVREIDYPPMSEGIAAVGKQLGVVCESGAKKYQKGGREPLDNIVFLAAPAEK